MSAADLDRYSRAAVLGAQSQATVEACDRCHSEAPEAPEVPAPEIAARRLRKAENRLRRAHNRATALLRERVQIDAEISQAQSEREKAHLLFRVSAFRSAARRFGIESEFYF